MGRGTGLGDRGAVPHHACRLAIVQRYGRCPLGQHQWPAHHNVCVAGCGAGQCRMAAQCALLLVAASAAGSGMGWLVLGHGVRCVQRLGHSGPTHDWHAAGGGALAYPRAHMALAYGVVDGADRGGAAGSVELVATRVLAELCGSGGAVCHAAP